MFQNHFPYQYEFLARTCAGVHSPNNSAKDATSGGGWTERVLLLIRTSKNDIKNDMKKRTFWEYDFIVKIIRGMRVQKNA